MDIDINVRHILCPQKTHPFDRKFNMSAFNYSTVSEVGAEAGVPLGGALILALGGQESSWS